MSENKKYVPDTLSKKEKAKQRKILKERKQKAKKGVYVEKKVSKKTPKKSSYTIRFRNKYKLSSYSLPSIAKATGIPVKALREVKKKGLGAYYSAGSRPNTTATQWAMARVYSYILGGGARKVDKAITKKYNVKFP